MDSIQKEFADKERAMVKLFNAKKVDTPISKPSKTPAQIKDIHQATKTDKAHQPQKAEIKPADVAPKPEPKKLPSYEIKTKSKPAAKTQKPKKEI